MSWRRQMQRREPLGWGATAEIMSYLSFMLASVVGRSMHRCIVLCILFEQVFKHVVCVGILIRVYVFPTFSPLNSLTLYFGSSPLRGLENLIYLCTVLCLAR